MARMIRVCFVMLILICLASPGRAQNVSQYLTIVREYAAGQGNDAETRLAG